MSVEEVHSQLRNGIFSRSREKKEACMKLRCASGNGRFPSGGRVTVKMLWNGGFDVCSVSGCFLALREFSCGKFFVRGIIVLRIYYDVGNGSILPKTLIVGVKQHVAWLVDGCDCVSLIRYYYVMGSFVVL